MVDMDIKNLKLKISITAMCLLLVVGFVFSVKITNAQKQLVQLQESLMRDTQLRSEMRQRQLQFSLARETTIRKALTVAAKEVSEQITTATTVPGKVVTVQKKVVKEKKTKKKKSKKKSRTS